MNRELIKIRRDLHQIAEVGTHLQKTKEYIKRTLEEYGYGVKEIANSSLYCEITGKPGKTILLRADMDALHIEEKTNLDFRAINGNMHACGHDMHATMLLGAAKLLKKHQSELNGTVKLLFQEDEEGFSGAKTTIKDGILDHPKVDAAMALHVNSGTPSGMVLCGLGHFMAGCTLFRITVKGIGCHGAMPETGINPINVACHIHQALQSIINYEVNAQDSSVLTIGKFAAGTTFNIIPDCAVLEGTIRYKNRETGDYIFGRIQEISESIAASFRGSASVKMIASAPPLINNDEMIYECKEYIKEIVDENKIMILPEGGMGSEDFASFSYEVPCAYLLLGAGSKQENAIYGQPMHNEKVVFNEDVLVEGAHILFTCAKKMA